MTAPAMITEGPAATEAVGAAIGAVLRPGDLIALDGDLGAGKTCFVRGMAEGCGVDPDLVRSPTYVFHHVYPGVRLTLHHIDCYRLGAGADVGFLDLDALLEDGAVAIEWGGLALLGAYQPVRVIIDVGSGDERAIELGVGAPERFIHTMQSLSALDGIGVRGRDGQ